MANKPRSIKRTEEGLTRELERAQAQQQTVVLHLIEWGRSSGLPPGLMVLGLIEFLALMIHTNFTSENRPHEQERLASYLRDRIAELEGDHVSH